MAPALGAISPDPAFLRGVEEELGQKIASCFHCSKCASGCPVAFAMDVQPNRVVRLVQMGLKDEALRSSSIWLCASCETCVTRCPNQVDIPAMMDVLRQIAIREKVPAADPAIPAFHAAFLSSVGKHGRVHDLGMLTTYKAKARKRGDALKDAGLGWEMFKRGKLRILPSKARETKQIRKMLREIVDRI